ncbi:MAG: hypothetical protein JWP35_620 [Caulobacter sp.]|nr:hypothetical protein [Caulobacter sp.]
MTGSLQSPPIVLTQSRLMLGAIGLIGLPVLAFGFYMPQHHYMIDGLIPAEWVLIPGGALTILFGALGMIRPGRLTLSPAGIGYRLMLSERRLAWREVRGVGFWSHNGREMGVSLALASGRPLRLASGWGMDKHALARLVEEARVKWSAPAPSYGDAEMTNFRLGPLG